MAVTPFYFVIIFLLVITATARNTRFDRFFPNKGSYFNDIRDSQCAALYAAQKSDAEDTFRSGLCTDVLDCILANTKESIKANMASAAVGLGIMPTILTFLGSSTTETALLSRRRPLLSFLIACGSPAVSPLPTFIYQDPVAGLKAREGRLLPKIFPRLSAFQAVSIALVEYTLVIAAIVNVITSSYYMGVWTICTVACPNDFLPILWVALTVLIHLFGKLALALRTETIRDIRTQSMWARFSEWKHYEFNPCVIHKKLVLEPKAETTFFIIISWFTSIGTVTHLLYGTVAFSSLTFISMFPSIIIQFNISEKLTKCYQGWEDSLKLMARFMASAIICRAVLMFELAGMRNALFERRRTSFGDETVRSIDGTATGTVIAHLPEKGLRR